jgi:predicted nuclease with TOPRIM domain
VSYEEIVERLLDLELERARLTRDFIEKKASVSDLNEAVRTIEEERAPLYDELRRVTR